MEILTHIPRWVFVHLHSCNDFWYTLIKKPDFHWKPQANGVRINLQIFSDAQLWWRDPTDFVNSAEPSMLPVVVFPLVFSSLIWFNWQWAHSLGSLFLYFKELLEEEAWSKHTEPLILQLLVITYCFIIAEASGKAGLPSALIQSYRENLLLNNSLFRYWANIFSRVL